MRRTILAMLLLCGCASEEERCRAFQIQPYEEQPADVKLWSSFHLRGADRDTSELTSGQPFATKRTADSVTIFVTEAQNLQERRASLDAVCAYAASNGLTLKSIMLGAKPAPALADLKEF